MVHGTGARRRLLHQLSRQPDFQVVSELGRIGVRLVHAHFGVDGVYALELARRLSIPLITTFHGFDAATPIWRFLISGRPALITYAILRQRLLRFGSSFLCASNYVRERAIGFGCPEKRTETHYTGIDTKFIRPLDADTPDKIILHIARLVGIKGTRYLIDAFSEVVAKVPAARLVIIGDGPLRKQLQGRVADKNLCRFVEFVGYQPYGVVTDWLRRSSVLCLPSVTTRSAAEDGLGTVLLEAAAASIPSVEHEQADPRDHRGWRNGVLGAAARPSEPRR